jgi:riboflavin synthase
MFTGIIQHVGEVVGLAATPAGKRLAVDLGPLADGLREGESVAVGGACLTAAVVKGKGGVAEFDVVPETLAKTTLGRLRVGSQVNLERSLRLGDGLDGHIVQGHVDGSAGVRRIDKAGGQWVVHFDCEKSLTDEMAPKGSVAIDGVSLTLASVEDGGFSVALIPTTLAKTTLADLRPGDAVNVETDVLGKYVRRMLGQRGGLDMETLHKAGLA